MLSAALATLMLVTSTSTPARCEQPFDGEMRWSALESFIQANAIRDVDTFLACLPRSYRRHFTLVYESRSPEQVAVDYRFPRILLFGEDARLIIAATGDPDRPFFDELQVLEFEEEAARFVLRRVVFAAERPPEIAVNPPACLECHGRDPRPLWDNYDFWPGVYGSDNDELKRGSIERQRFLDFKRHHADRYRALLFGRSALSPFHGDEEETTVANSPNFRLGKLLWRYNARRVMRQLRAAPRFEEVRERLASALLGCEPYPFDQASLARMTRLLASEMESKLARMPPDGRKSLAVHPRFYARGAARIDLLARLLGVDPSEWSTSLQRGSWDMHDGDAGLDDLLLTELLRSIAQERMELAAFIRIVDEGEQFQSRGFDPLGPLGGPQRYGRWSKRFTALGGAVHLKTARRACALLRGEGDGPLWSGLAEPQRAEAVTAVSPLESHCADCHDGFVGGGRALPFTEPDALRKLLLAEPRLHADLLRRIASTGRDRMPPQERLAPAEVEAIRTYIESLLETDAEAARAAD